MKLPSYGSPKIARVLLVTLALLFVGMGIHQGRKYVHKRRSKARDFCIRNIEKIDGAKQQWKMLHPSSPNVELTFSDLVHAQSYLIKTPHCPSGGEYSIGKLDEAPTCSKGSFKAPYAHQLDNPERRK